MVMISTGWGTIEGFFGRAWDWAARADHIRFLASAEARVYIYAPKSDRALRADWRKPWTDSELAELCQLRAVARQSGIGFGIGFCPFDLFGWGSAADRQDLAAKLSQINAVAPDLLAVLYDDTRGGAADLVDGQLAVFDQIAAQTNAAHLAFCPAYYSDDPILDTVFGPRPDGYLEALGRALDPSVDMFWTGPQVISSHYPAAHLDHVAERMRRKPLLWDNWPVNDSRKLSPFLRLRPPQGRGPELHDRIAGLICNPMNQAALSQLPLFALSKGWLGADPKTAWNVFLDHQLPADLAKALRRDLWLMQDQGQAALTA